MQDRAAAPQRSAVNCRVTDIDPGHNVSVCALERRRVVLKPVAYCCSLLIVFVQRPVMFIQPQFKPSHQLRCWRSCAMRLQRRHDDLQQPVGG